MVEGKAAARKRLRERLGLTGACRCCFGLLLLLALLVLLFMFCCWRASGGFVFWRALWCFGACCACGCNCVLARLPAPKWRASNLLYGAMVGGRAICVSNLKFDTCLLPPIVVQAGATVC